MIYIQYFRLVDYLKILKTYRAAQKNTHTATTTDHTANDNEPTDQPIGLQNQDPNVNGGLLGNGTQNTATEYTNDNGADRHEDEMDSDRLDVTQNTGTENTNDNGADRDEDEMDSDGLDVTKNSEKASATDINHSRRCFHGLRRSPKEKKVQKQIGCITNKTGYTDTPN